MVVFPYKLCKERQRSQWDLFQFFVRKAFVEEEPKIPGSWLTFPYISHF